MGDPFVHAHDVDAAPRSVPAAEKRSRGSRTIRREEATAGSLGEGDGPVVGVLGPPLAVVVELGVHIQLGEHRVAQQQPVERAPEADARPVAEELEAEDALELLGEDVLDQAIL